MSTPDDEWDIQCKHLFIPNKSYEKWIKRPIFYGFLYSMLKSNILTYYESYDLFHSINVINILER